MRAVGNGLALILAIIAVIALLAVVAAMALMVRSLGGWPRASSAERGKPATPGSDSGTSCISPRDTQQS